LASTENYDDPNKKLTYRISGLHGGVSVNGGLMEGLFQRVVLWLYTGVSEEFASSTFSVETDLQNTL
jgi:hypothetical protein